MPMSMTPPGKLSNYVEMLAANGSIFTILAISFERYYAICEPLKAGYKCTRLRATIIICLIWLLASILTSPILIMAKSSETVYIDGSLVYNCILETDTYWHKMYVFVSMFAFFCLPLIVLMLVYWLIGRRLIRENLAMSRRQMATTPSHCPSTATASTDLISTAHEHHHQHHHHVDSQTISNHSSNGGWYQAGKRIGLRKAASLKSISGFFASFGHLQNHHDHNHNHLQQTNQHHHCPCQQQQHNHHQLSNNGPQMQSQQRRQLRLKASKAFSLDSHSRISGKQQANGCCERIKQPPTLEISLKKSHENRLADSSCLSPHDYYGCCCCCRRLASSGSSKWMTNQKGSQKSGDGLILSIFKQLQLTPSLRKLSWLWSSMEKAAAPASCSTFIGTDSNQGKQQNDGGSSSSSSDCNNNINNNNISININNNNNNNFDVDRSTSGGSCTDIDGQLLSSSCYSTRRVEGITIMNSISESMPIPVEDEMSGGHGCVALSEESGGIANERLVVVSGGNGGDDDDKSESFSCCRKSSRQMVVAAAESGHRQLLAEYANDDDDYDENGDSKRQAASEVDDPGGGGGRGSQPKTSPRAGLKYWLANTLFSYSRSKSCSCRYCHRCASSKLQHESRCDQQDNGPLMASEDGDIAQSSGPLIAVRPDKLRRQQCRHRQRQNDVVDDDDDDDDNSASDSDDKSAAATAAAVASKEAEPLKRCSQKANSRCDDSHYELGKEPQLPSQLHQQQAKKSAHFDISTKCTFGRHRDEASSSSSLSHCRRQQQQQIATNARATIHLDADVFNSFDCVNGSAASAASNISSSTAKKGAGAAGAVSVPVRRQAEAAQIEGNRCSSCLLISGSNSKSTSPDSIHIQGVTFRNSQHQSDQIMENPLKDDDDGEKEVTHQSKLILLQSFEGAHLYCQCGLSTKAPATGSRPSSVAALSGSSAVISPDSCASQTTTVPFGPVTDRDSSMSTPLTAASATTATILFVESDESYQHHNQTSSSCSQEVAGGKQMTAITRQVSPPITSVVMAATMLSPPLKPSERIPSTDEHQYTTTINEKSSRANSLVLDGESSVSKNGRRLGRMSSHHLAKRFRTRSASKPIVCSQLHNGAHLSELFIVQDLSKKQQMDSRRQVVIMLAFVVACFFLLFFPYRVFTVWLILSTEDQVQSLGMEAYYNLTYFSRILIYLHSAINPIAYNLISTKFRRAFMSILLCRGSSTRRHFTTDHQQRLANQLSCHNSKRKLSGSTTATTHQPYSSRSSVVCQPLSTTPINTRRLTTNR